MFRHEVYKDKSKLFIREEEIFISESKKVTEKSFIIKGYSFGIGNGTEKIEFDFDEADLTVSLTRH